MFGKFAGGDRSAIHPNIRASVYGIVLQNGGEKEYDIILNESRTANTSDERNTAMRSLGRARDPKLIQRTLAMPLTDEVKGQDVHLPLGSLRTHGPGIEALWNWLQQNWAQIEIKLPHGLTMLSSVVQICTASFTSQAKVDEITEFFKKHSTKGFDQGLAQSLDSIKAKALWVEKDRSDVSEWLANNQSLLETVEEK
ncbi:MAG: Aminopeptidase 2 mitochondrial [Trizodia sp. TS-e1964]|nr:MAG: Aminopeptidase 2 mitochondrial [Trizodia sp. TS-e1964]